MTTTLVLGGASSGAVRHAAELLASAGSVTVLAPDPRADLPAQWTQSQSTDFTHGFLRSRVPVLIPDLTGWVRTMVDEHDAWASPEQAAAAVRQPIDELAALWGAAPWDAVACCDDPGLGPTPSSPRDALLAQLTASAVHELAAVSSRVELLVAGRIIDLTSAPRA